MLRPWESKRGVLGWLQAFRHGRDVPVPVWRERSAAPMATLAKSSLMHNRGHHALAAMPKVRVTRCLGGGQRCGVPVELCGQGCSLGGLRSPGSRIGAVPSSTCPSDPWSHSCWVTGDGAQQGL